MTSPRPIPCVSHLDLRLEAPPSKSVTQRALIAASLADGVSRLRRPLLGDDGRRMVAALGACGIAARVEGERDASVVEVVGRPRVRPPGGLTLDIGNAGTAMRFLAARLAVGPVPVVIDGSPRMRERPIEDLLAALRVLGAEALSLGGNGCPPVRVGGRGMAGGTVRIAGARSSQFVSALLLAAPAAEQGVAVAIDGDLVSRPYVDLTLDVMRAFGAHPVSGPPGRADLEFALPPGERYRPVDLRIEGDWSSASYWFAAAALVPGRVRVDGLLAASAQGDARFLDVLEAMGCHVTRAGGPVVVEGPETLRGVTADLCDMPDVAPSLAVTALFARDPTRIVGVPHLRLKESDRIAVLCEAIRGLGGDAEPLEDGLLVRPRTLAGGAVDPRGDHRMAMAFAVAGLRLPGVTILDPGCVEKSYPDFWGDLTLATGEAPPTRQVD
jgi:3-phosphoshikimate 1-carboxyvinyltransferase